MTDDKPRLEDKDLKTDNEIFLYGSIDNVGKAKNEISLILKKAPGP